MKKKGILAAGIIAVLLVGVFAVGCKNNTNPNDAFAGTWVSGNIKIIASADGAFVAYNNDIQQGVGTYRVEGNIVYVTSASAGEETGELNGNTFTYAGNVYTKQ